VVTTTDDVGGAYAMGDDPVRGLVSSDNSMLYIANFRSQWVTVYAIDDGRASPPSTSATVHPRWRFPATAILLFVVDTRSGDVAVVRTARTRSSRCSPPAAPPTPSPSNSPAFKLTP
jgi:DNA-binding beta-propeller fold protein YncE